VRAGICAHSAGYVAEQLCRLCELEIGVHLFAAIEVTDDGAATSRNYAPKPSNAA
jgi:hypothetical protein